MASPRRTAATLLGIGTVLQCVLWSTLPELPALGIVGFGFAAVSALSGDFRLRNFCAWTFAGCALGAAATPFLPATESAVACMAWSALVGGTLNAMRSARRAAARSPPVPSAASAAGAC